MDFDQDYLDFLHSKPKPPEWAMYFSMLEDAVKSFLGDLDVGEFLKKFNCNNSNYIDAMFWLFDISEDDGDPRPKFEEVWETIFPDLHIDARETKRQLQKRVFERIHSYCNEQEIKNFTNVIVQKFGEVLSALDSTINEVRKRHEEKKNTPDGNGNGSSKQVIKISINQASEGEENETTCADGRRGSESSGDDSSSGDPGIAEGDSWFGCLFDGVDGGGDDSTDGGGSNGGFPGQQEEPKRKSRSRDEEYEDEEEFIDVTPRKRRRRRR